MRRLASSLICLDEELEEEDEEDDEEENGTEPCTDCDPCKRSNSAQNHPLTFESDDAARQKPRWREH